MFTISKPVRKACHITIISAGILGILAAQLEFLIDMSRGDDDSLGTIAVKMSANLFAFMAVALAAVGLSTDSKISGVLLIVVAAIAAILGGKLLIIFMALTIATGLFVLLANKPEIDMPSRSDGKQNQPLAGLEAKKSTGNYGDTVIPQAA